MKYVVILIAVCFFGIGTQLVAKHTHKVKYKKTVKTGRFVRNHGCACGH